MSKPIREGHSNSNINPPPDYPRPSQPPPSQKRNDEKEKRVFDPEAYLFRKFQRMYHEKFDRIPERTDVQDQYNFEIFKMGYDACKKSHIVAHESEAV